MSRFWGQNIQIDGSTVKEQFEDPLAKLYLPGEGPPELVTHDTSNPQAAAYENATQEVLRQIAKTPVGAILIQRINALSRRVTIRPLNEKAIGLTGTVADDAQAARAGSQGGSNVTTWYDPSTWNSAVAKTGVDPGNHYRPDDVLFHELVHALRMQRGLWDPARIVTWDNIEDLFAIMLTNIYLSSNNRDQDLRGDHGKFFRALPKSLLRPNEQQSDQAFYLQNDNYIDRLCGSLPDLCAPITLIQCHWNPLRARVNYMNAVRMFK